MPLFKVWSEDNLDKKFVVVDNFADRLNWQNSGEFDQNFSKKSNARGFARGGAWAVLEIDRYINCPIG